MDPRQDEREFLLNVFKVVSRSFLCGDRDLLKPVLNIIDKTDFPRQTRYSKVLLNLKKAIKSGIQQGQYDALCQTEDQSVKVHELLENERDAWHKVSEGFHKLGGENLANLAKAWVHKCRVYLGQGKPSDAVINAYSASKLFEESGEDEVAAILFADVLTREIFPRYLWEKYELIDLMSHLELIPRLFLFEWIEIDEKRLCALVRQHVETLLKIVDSQDGIESMKAMEALRKIGGRVDEDQLLEATKILVEKWKRKDGLHALMRRRITKTLSGLYVLVGNHQKTEIISVISEALQDEDKRVREVAVGFFNRYYSFLELRWQYYVTRKAFDLLNSSDFSLKENGLSLLSGVDLSVLKFKEPKSDLLLEIDRIADFAKCMYANLLEEKNSSTRGMIDSRFNLLSNVFESIGRFYESIQDEQHALEFYTHSIKFSIKGYMGNEESLAYKVASTYAKKKRWKDLAEFWHELSKIKLQKENYGGAVILLRNAATSYLRIKKRTEALDMVRKMCDIAKQQLETGKYRDTVFSYGKAAEIYIAMKLCNEAIRLAWKIEEMSDKAGILALRETAEIYLAVGMDNEVSATLRKMLALNKTLREIDTKTGDRIELLTDVLFMDSTPSTKIFNDDEEGINVDETSNMFAYGFEVPEPFWHIKKSDEVFCARMYWLKEISNMMLQLDNDKDVLEIARELVLMAEKPDKFGNPSEWDKQSVFCAAGELYKSLGKTERAAKCLEKAARISVELGDWELKRIPSMEIFASLYLDAREIQKAKQKPDPNSNVRDRLAWVDEANRAFNRVCNGLGLSSPNVLSDFEYPSIWAAICYEHAAYCLREAADDYLNIGMNDHAFTCYERALQYNSMCHREGCLSSEAEIASLFEKHSEASRLYNSLIEQARKSNEEWKVKYYSGLSAIEEGEALVLQGRGAHATRYFKKGIRRLDDARKLARQAVMLLQVKVCSFRSKYAKARLKIEQGFIEREEKEDYKQAIKRFKEAESFFKRLQRSELSKQEKTLLKGYGMFARAHMIITQSIVLKKHQKLAEANLAIEEATSIFSNISDMLGQTMRKKSAEWVSGVLSCLNATIEWQKGGNETRVHSLFENARLSLSKVIGEESIRKMNTREINKRLLGSMAFPLPAPMCIGLHLMEKTIKLEIVGEVPSEIEEGEVIHVKTIVRVEKTETSMPESLPLRLVIEQSGKRTIYPGEVGMVVSTDRYLSKHLSFLFDKSGEDVIRIGVEYVGSRHGCFIPLNRLTKRYKIKVQPREVSSPGMLRKAETSSEYYLQILDEIRDTKMLIEKLSSKVVTKDDLKETEKLLTDNQRKLQVMLSENMEDLKRTLGKDLEKKIGEKKANRFWQLLEKLATISDLVDFAMHVKDLLSFLNDQKIIHMALPYVLKMLLPAP